MVLISVSAGSIAQAKRRMERAIEGDEPLESNVDNKRRRRAPTRFVAGEDEESDSDSMPEMPAPKKRGRPKGPSAQSAPSVPMKSLPTPPSITTKVGKQATFNDIYTFNK